MPISDGALQLTLELPSLDGISDMESRALLQSALLGATELPVHCPCLPRERVLASFALMGHERLRVAIKILRAKATTTIDDISRFNLTISCSIFCLDCVSML